MAAQVNLREIANAISNIMQEVDKLKEMGSGIKCVEMNVVRMSAMIKMLELDITDVADVLGA
ncbi:hypothetical protein L9W92_00520 [Pelotomaculum terephthalicicum JT]|uniref:hypothetical protein n=1 Tax=Pelotomaculum terephthalicicum TaxID=206393 RepID=UPI0009C64744|nr:hypothetical protein [Pelotomaculum terephthalicicum]MCG9966541.1 hypothetical protein [Pelotomaculum terephthalicicum JT]OPY62825.1 MAG: hypothetical protein A4E56_01079 [Pelotomaculum sp. PtaU1.Bin065]